MRDFNFFSPYLKEKRNRRLKKIYIISVSSLLTAALLSFTAVNFYYIGKYQQEINTVQNYLNSDRTKELLKQYKETQSRDELLKAYYSKASVVDQAVSGSNTVTTVLLDSLSSIMPTDSFMTNLAIRDRDMEVQYSINDLVSVAELEHNLKELKLFDSVHVSIIEAETGYTAVIICSLKDVSSQ